MDWFPRMRAMSLVSNEGDSEQNEIRNLQEKLESTMSLVKQLSGQLAELKEQVCELRGRGHRNSGKETSPIVLFSGIPESRDSPRPLQAFLTLCKDRKVPLCFW